jgi:RNA polymerase sigma-70 factor (ECF subfamily)
MDMGKERESFQPFPTTRWSEIAFAGRNDGEERRRALEALLRRYLPPLRSYLTIRRGIPPDRTEDLLQDFVTDKVLQKDLLARADQRKGKFRTFLLTALDRFAIDRARRDSVRRRRTGGSAPELEDVDPRTVIVPGGDAAGAEWAREVVTMARDRLEAECKATGRSGTWEIFRLRFLDPLIEGVSPTGYRELVGKMGIQSPTQAANLLVTAKRMFARHLRAVVREYAIDDEVEEEIAELRRMIISDSRARSGRGARN